MLSSPHSATLNSSSSDNMREHRNFLDEIMYFFSSPIVSNESLKKHLFSTNLWIISETIWEVIPSIREVKYNYLAENEV